MDPNLRDQRRRVANDVARARLRAAILVTALLHVLVVVPLVAFFALQALRPHETKEPQVSLVRVPAEAWDSMRGPGSATVRRPPAAAAPTPRAAAAPEKKKEEEAKKKEPEQAPGQVVDTAPGNQQVPDDARFAAESSNQVEKETISQDRRPSRLTMPRETTSVPPAESTTTAPPKPQQPLAIGSPDEDGKDDRPKKDGEFGSKLELPSLLREEKLALKLDREGAGAFRNREETEALRGNSDRFRVQVGEGEGDAPDASTGGRKGSRDVASLLPSEAVLDRISGAPAPDHVDDVELGEGTFLNTKEWKFASFFNRVKQGVANSWDPVTALRRRDPSGEMYAWKDRYTIVQVTLDEGGNLRDIFVERSSGVDFLDREAISAFEKAQPFPNPPTGLVDGRREVHFSFGFYLETSRPAFRIFRGQ